MNNNETDWPMYVNGNGIVWNVKPRPEELPTKREIELCEQWIKKFMIPTQTLIKKSSSYNLKKKVEGYYERYISNGAFIRAAINCGYKIGVTNINAWFNMNQKRWKEYQKEQRIQEVNAYKQQLRRK